MLKIALMTTLAAAVSVAVIAQAPQPAAPAGGQGRGRGGQGVQPIQQVKPGLYMVAGAGANSLVRVTNDGVILVDGKLAGDQNYNGLIDQIKPVADKPVKFLIVTHHHADHTGNNAKFLEAGAQGVGDETRKKTLAHDRA